MENLPAHSPLGASGAARWLKCAGSVGLSEGIEDAESDFAALGTAAHVLLETCLTEKQPAWKRTGQFIWRDEVGPQQKGVGLMDGAIPVDADMANAVQVMIDAIDEAHPERDQGNSWIERKFHCPDIHPLFYGTADFVYYDETNSTVHVWDYKHGAGIVVEAENNVQTMYYAAGALTDLGLWDTVDTVVLHIGQPRGWHYEGPIREWAISTDDLDAWIGDVLVPGMDYALLHDETYAAEHCRFCAVRLRACPALDEKVDRLKELYEMADKKGGIQKMSNARLGELINLEVITKIKFKAARDVAFGRANAGKKVPGTKLVKARSNRVWKEGVEKKAKAAMGAAAYTKPKLKSPSEIEKLPKGAAFVEANAFKPDTGLTLVADDDRRREVSRDTKAGFKPVKKSFRKSK